MNKLAPTSFAPVIMNNNAQSRQKECIVVDQKVYCKTENVSPREIGVGLLVATIILIWISWAGYVWEENKIPALTLLSAFIITCLAMIIFGG